VPKGMGVRVSPIRPCRRDAVIDILASDVRYMGLIPIDGTYALLWRNGRRN
jgi:hypothetical protein